MMFTKAGTEHVFEIVLSYICHRFGNTLKERKKHLSREIYTSTKIYIYFDKFLLQFQLGYYLFLNMPIDLGFVQTCESWRLTSRFFPSKVGGKPAWLDLKNIPGKSDLECEYCNDVCIFLCQIYAPYEENDDAFHRTIYIFICKNIDCCRPNQNGNLKVFRSQLSRVNTFIRLNRPSNRRTGGQTLVSIVV